MSSVISAKMHKRYRYHIRKMSLRYAHRLHRLAHKEDYDAISRYLDKFRSSGGLKNPYGEYKLWNLTQLLTRFQPGSILEFGSGSSTLVFSEYVRRNEGCLLSIDEEEKWAANTRRLVDIKPDDRIEIKRFKKLHSADTHPREIKYEVSIKDQYDFVFIDGPSLNVDGAKWKDAVNSNILDLSNAPAVIVVDGRKATALFLADRYADRYHISLSDLFSGKPVKRNYKYFSYFYKRN